MSQSVDKGADTQMQGFPVTRKLHLLDLPYDVMEMVIPKLDIDHQMLIRSASKELREFHTCFMMRNYKWYLANCARQRKPTENAEELAERIMLQVLNIAFEYYLREGFESQFASNMLFFQYQKSLGVEMPPYSLFNILFRFQHCLEGLPSHNVQDLRLIYTVTLFSLLRRFHSFRIVESGMNLMHWQVTVELSNVFLGVLDERAMLPRITNRNKLFGLLSILAELLCYVKMNKGFGGFKDTGNVVYTYGFQSNTKRKPRLVIKCMAMAPKRVLRLLQNVITGKDVPKTPIQVPPGAAFRARLQVNCKPAKRFFDYGTMHINICQHDELSR